MTRAEELKRQLGERARQIILDGLGQQEVGGKIKCPIHNEQHPSMSWYRDALCYRCHACEATLDIYRYYTDMEHKTFPEALQEVERLLGVESYAPQPMASQPKRYVLPNIDMQDLSEAARHYMHRRKITDETLAHFGIKQRHWANQDVYVFPYQNEKGALEYVTYRGIGKGAIKGGCEKNTKPILFGMPGIDKRKPLVITEGQIDCMSVWQAGYTNVVSVPNGSNNFEWINTCWDWLQGISEIIVLADNDEPGLKMANNIKSRLKNVKIATYSARKDANEVLYHEGPEAVLSPILMAINAMPEGMIDLADQAFKSKKGDVVETIETGFRDYDAEVEDWKLGEITVVFGRNGEGKSTFISQVIGHCIEQDNRVFLYSGEMSDNKIQDWLYRQLVGNKSRHLQTVDGKYGGKKEVRPQTIEKIQNWHRGKLFLYDRSVKELAGNLDKFFEIAEYAVKRYGVKLVVIDNLMAILEENADSLFSDQANFVQRCKYFAITNNCHVVLLAHPNKVKAEIKKAESNLEKTDISGSNNIANKADNIIGIERIWGEHQEFDAVISSLKDRESGQRKRFLYKFSRETLRFYNAATPEEVFYSWDESTPEYRQVEMDADCPF